jgi:Transglutaminase-like superfamily
MAKRVLGITIVLVWLGMVGWQVRAEYFQPELTRLAEAALSLAPGVNFYTLTMGDRTVGQATSRLDTLPDGFALEDVMSLELPALGQTGTAVARTRVKLSPALVMDSFTFSLDSEVGRFEAFGSLGADTTLSVSIVSAGNKQDLSFRLPQPPVVSNVVPIRIAMGGALEVGNTVRLPVFDPTTMSSRTVQVDVEDYDTLFITDSVALDTLSGRWSSAHTDSVPAWKIAETFGGVRVESWVDADGRTLRSSSPLGFSMEKTEYELARQATEDSRLVSSSPIDDDVILSTAVQSNVNLDDVEQFDELRFRLTGVDLAGFQLDGGRQTLRGDTLIIRRENWDSLETYDLPYRFMDLRDALQPEPLIQSDDERIVQRAGQIVGRRPYRSLNAKQVARELTMSVNSMLEKKITFSVPNAVQVLQTLQGDCNEHTVLYVAFARALGLPARTAVGLVYLNGSFFYHAWPEVWLGEWVAVDPTFGQYPADASHIRFVVGGLAEQVEIVRLIGHLDIDVLPSPAAP